MRSTYSTINILMDILAGRYFNRRVTMFIGPDALQVSITWSDIVSPSSTDE